MQILWTLAILAVALVCMTQRSFSAPAWSSSLEGIGALDRGASEGFQLMYK